MPSFDFRTIAQIAIAVGALALAGCQPLRPIKYTVHGAVAAPGDYISRKAITLDEAIAKAGGLADGADPSAISISYGYIGTIVSLESQGHSPIKSTTSITVPTEHEMRRMISKAQRTSAF